MQEFKQQQPITIDNLILKHLGNIGKYQCHVYLLSILPIFISGTLSTSLIFITGVPQYRCLIPNCDQFTDDLNNTSIDNFGENIFKESHLHFTIPKLTHDDSKYDSCHSFRMINDDNDTDYCQPSNYDNSTIDECLDGYIFDNEYFQTTIITEFELYCDRLWIVQLLQAIYFFGIVISSIISGILADKFGRKSIFYIYSPLIVLSIVTSLFTKNLSLFGLAMFTKGLCNAAIYQSAFAIAMECLGDKWRFWLGNLSGLSFTLGAIYISICSWWLRQWRLIEICNLIPAIIMLTYPFIMPESIRWQYSSGQHSKAIEHIIIAAKKNNRLRLSSDKQTIDKLVNEINNTTTIVVDCEKNYSIFNLFQHSKICKWTLSFLFIWYTNALVYYGLTFLAQEIHTNIYYSMILLLLIEFPGVFMAGYLGNFTRKYFLLIILLFGGICYIGSSFIATGHWMKIVMAILGKMSITASFALIFVYAAEIFPTPLRTTGIGMCAFAARIGAMSAPFLFRLSAYGESIPFIAIGIITFAAGLITIILPETKGKKLPDTMDDVLSL